MIGKGKSSNLVDSPARFGRGVALAALRASCVQRQNQSVSLYRAGAADTYRQDPSHVLVHAPLHTTLQPRERERRPRISLDGAEVTGRVHML